MERDPLDHLGYFIQTANDTMAKWLFKWQFRFRNDASHQAVAKYGAAHCACTCNIANFRPSATRNNNRLAKTSSLNHCRATATAESISAAIALSGCTITSPDIYSCVDSSVHDHRAGPASVCTQQSLNENER